MNDFRDFLVERGVVSDEQLDEFIGSEPATAEPLYYRLLRKQPALEGPIWQALAAFIETDLVDAEKERLDPGLVRVVPARLAYRYSIVPLRRQGNVVDIAVADPRQFEKCDEFALMFAQHGRLRDTVNDPPVVTPRLARPSDVAKLLRMLYGLGADTVEDMLESGNAVQVSGAGPEIVELTHAEPGGEDAAIVRFVNQLLLEAAKIGASDIHVEPFEKELVVRFRVDGVLQREPVPERIKHLEAAIISRIKIMAGLDIAEKRLPQDGQIRLTVMGRPIDVRVSVLPTVFGQGLALRLLDRQMAFRRLDNLGMPDDYLALYRHGLGLLHGVVLITGPTGSGKTTTLYASISEINDVGRKIITVEDPVEYQLSHITQIPVRPNIDLTFANILRNIVRHDPDVIMVGEIRDSATAQIAVSAAMTGHLVFSTLHTNDAASAPVRLLEMGVEPFLVSSSLEVVGAQRLVRVLCRHCRAPLTLDAQLAPKERALLDDGPVYSQRGCRACRQTGYQGRTAIFEIFALSDPIRQLVLDRASANAIRRRAIAQGMRTLYQSGLEKVRAGVTSLAEVYRVAREEAIDMQAILETPDNNARNPA